MLATAALAAPAFASDLDGVTVNAGLPAQGAAYDAAVAQSGPAGWYKLDDPAGSATALDSSGNGNDLAQAGSVSFGQAGVFDPSLAAGFNAGSWLSRPGFAASDNYTLEAWFKPADLNNGLPGDIVGNGCTCSGFWQGSFLMYSGGHVYGLVTSFQGTFLDAGAISDPDTWHHVVLERENGVASVWLDGHRARQTTTQFPTGQETFMIGARPGYETLKYSGLVDNVAFYNRALSADEIVDHWLIGIDDDPPANTAAPTVSQDDYVDGRAIADPGSWSDHADPTYQWRRCDAQGNSCTPIAGADARDYVIRPADEGGTLRVTVTHENRHGSTWASSQPWGPIGRNKVTAYDAAIAADSPTGFWRLDELPGDETAVDFAGDRTLSIAGPVTLAQDGSFDGSRAIQFSGGHLDGPGVEHDGDFAMEAWFKPSGYVGVEDVIANGCTCGGFWRGAFAGVTGGGVPMLTDATGFPNGDAVSVGDTSVTTGAWHHMLMQRENGVNSIWLDGVQQQDTNTVAPGGQGGRRIGIGWRPEYGLPFYGLIDNVAYYDHALSQTRIFDHVRAGEGNFDDAPPTLTLGGGLATAASGWIADGSYTLHVDAGDGGSGVSRVEMEVDGQLVDSAGQTCTAGSCSLVHDFTFDASAYPTGEHVVRVTAIDAEGNRTSQTVTVRIDHDGPAIGLSGPLTAQPSFGNGSFALQVAATDGSAAAPQSGVKSVEVLVDGTRADFVQQSCAADSCPLDRTFTLDTSSLGEGRHVVRVIAVDQVGNASQRDVPIIVDRTAPTVALSGTLVAGSGLSSWLGGSSYALHVDAGDGAGATPGSGVASIEVLVDGTRVDFAQQPCAAGDCAMTRDFTLDAAAYAEGRHTVTVAVTDQVGRRTTRNLLVQLDRSDPDVTLSGDLWDAAGTTISRGNYDVTVDATDGSGFTSPRSGVKSIEILMNGTTVDLATQTCAQFDSCPLSSNYRFKVNQHPNGTYAFDVVVTDFAGHAVTRSWQVVKFR